jgi:Holliday junction resolvase RusA-like endonuclease
VSAISFTVYGVPQSKGSAKAFIPKGWSRAIVTTATKGLKAWEQQIAAAAQAHAGTLMEGAITIHLAFYLPRPKSLAKKLALHTKRPDLDKLIRGATDALTHVLFHDDAQIVSIMASKHYAASANETPRAEFTLATIEPASAAIA